MTSFLILLFFCYGIAMGNIWVAGRYFSGMNSDHQTEGGHFAFRNRRLHTCLGVFSIGYTSAQRKMIIAYILHVRFLDMKTKTSTTSSGPSPSPSTRRVPFHRLFVSLLFPVEPQRPGLARSCAWVGERPTMRPCGLRALWGHSLFLCAGGPLRADPVFPFPRAAGASSQLIHPAAASALLTRDIHA